MTTERSPGSSMRGNPGGGFGGGGNPSPGPGPHLGTFPNPNPDDLDAQRRRAASGTARSFTVAEGGGSAVSPPADRPVVVAVSPTGAVTRARRHERFKRSKRRDRDAHPSPPLPPLPPHAPLVVDAFAAVILALFLVGAVACAVAFPIQGARDTAGDDTRWGVTLARWSAAREFPPIPQLAPFDAILRGGSALEGVDALFAKNAKDETDAGAEAPNASPAPA